MPHQSVGAPSGLTGRLAVPAVISGPPTADAPIGTLPPASADPWVGTLYDYWRRCRPADGTLPGRQHIDPLAFAEFWPWIWMADIVGVPARFRFRLLGGEHVRLMKGEYTGQWIDEVLPPAKCPLIHGALEQAASGAPAYCRSPSYVRYDGDPVLHVLDQMAERLYLPLARDGCTPDMVLALTIVQARPRA